MAGVDGMSQQFGLGSLDHGYRAVEGGCSFYTDARIGNTLPVVGSALGWLIRRFAFTEELIRAWIVHNIEESGETEKSVPLLFADARPGAQTVEWRA